MYKPVHRVSSSVARSVRLSPPPLTPSSQRRSLLDLLLLLCWRRPVRVALALLALRVLVVLLTGLLGRLSRAIFWRGGIVLVVLVLIGILPNRRSGTRGIKPICAVAELELVLGLCPLGLLRGPVLRRGRLAVRGGEDKSARDLDGRWN